MLGSFERDHAVPAFSNEESARSRHGPLAMLQCFCRAAIVALVLPASRRKENKALACIWWEENMALDFMR